MLATFNTALMSKTRSNYRIRSFSTKVTIYISQIHVNKEAAYCPKVNCFHIWASAGTKATSHITLYTFHKANVLMTTPSSPPWPRLHEVRGRTSPTAHQPLQLEAWNFQRKLRTFHLHSFRQRKQTHSCRLVKVFLHTWLLTRNSFLFFFVMPSPLCISVPDANTETGTN